MPSKKLTAQKREELKIKKQKANQPSYLKSILTLIIVITVIAIAAYAAFLFLSSDEPIDDTNPPIIPQNNAPNAVGDYALFALNSSNNTLDLLMNDNDADLDNLTITDVENPTNGIAEIVNEKLLYTPNENFTGIDEFTYTISDGEYTTTADINIVVANNSVVNGNNPITLIDTTEGMIVVELYEDEMPITCENFIRYANDNFYEGLCFHRIGDGFMIQGGAFAPDQSYKQPTYDPIELEISDTLIHDTGSISMARTTEENSATSQFFICDAPQPGLDGSYAVFGKTIMGIDVVHAIADKDHDDSNGDGTGWPIDNVIINRIVVENQR